MFNTNTSKPLRLEEFEQSQLSACTTTTLYLEDPWINATRGGVRSALQYMGKGKIQIFDKKIDSFVQKLKFCSKTEILFKIGIFFQKWKFCPKLEILFKIGKFAQKWKIFSKLETGNKMSIFGK